MSGYPTDPYDPYSPKDALGSIYPVNAVEGTPIERVEPLLTPDLLKSRHLFGIPLVSATKNPITGQYDVLQDHHLTDYITGAVSRVEEALSINIFPVRREEKHPWDKHNWDAFGHLKVQHAPIQKLYKLSVTPSNGIDIYIVPLDWVEASYFAYGQINIVPLTIANIGGIYMAPSASQGGAQFLNILGMRGWIPAFWQVEYVSGFEEGKIPRTVNELVGIFAAIRTLEQLAATNRQQSFSLSIDGMSQSVSTPGVEVYSRRLEQLEREKATITNKLKAMYRKKMFVGVV